MFSLPAIKVVMLRGHVGMQRLSLYDKVRRGDGMYSFGVCCGIFILRGALEFVRADR